MSIHDEFHAATAALDRILAKLEKAVTADKAKLEEAAKSAQKKVQDILSAISRIR
jgi:ribosome-associated translation inhibitor RaiA